MTVISIAERYGEDDRILADETADVLRKWLEMAERGEIISVALAGEMTCGDIATGHSHAAKRYCVIGALAALQSDLVKAATDDV